MDKAQLVLFARWMAICYADEHIDDQGTHQAEPDYDRTTGMSVLNRESGEWYKKQVNYFEEVVFPNYIKNGSYEDHKKFLE